MTGLFWKACSRIADTHPQERVMAKIDAPIYDVFLGGSCGRTSWRRTKIIPVLERLGLTYYNPQKEQWRPELIETEEVAKRNCRLLLFVIHKGTVSATSLTEIAFLAASKAPLVVVLPPLNKFTQVACCPDDRLDREEAHKFLSTILKNHNVPCFENMDAAITHLEHKFVGEIFLSDAIRSSKKRWIFFKIKTKGMYKDLWRRLDHIRTTPLKRIGTSCRGWMRAGYFACERRNKRELAHFAGIVLETLVLMVLTAVLPHIAILLALGVCLHLWFCIRHPHQQESLLSSGGRRRRRSKSARYDVFLCSNGSGFETEWITHRAVPILSKYGLSYSESGYCETYGRRFQVALHCDQILFNFSTPYRPISGFLELAYYVGLGRRIVSCIPKENLWMDPPPIRSVRVSSNNNNNESCVHGNGNFGVRRRNSENRLSTRNNAMERCFQYLKDMADRAGIPIHDNLNSALRQIALQALIAAPDVPQLNTVITRN